jgi:UDP-N-acetylglucosamine:LPS N-acetylglucosamine transferase
VLTGLRAGNRILIVSASVGAGHDGVATELARRLRERGFQIELVDFLDLLPGVLGAALRRAYALALAVAPSSWQLLYTTLDRHPRQSAAVAGLANLARPRMLATLGTDCRAVVSTYPLASQVLGQLRRHGTLTAPVTTFLCDMSVHSLWVSTGVDAHLAMHKVTADQADALGAPGVHITAPAIAPSFRPARSPAETAAARARFGLPTEGKLALVLAGSWAVGQVERTVHELAATAAVRPVVVCGRNTGLHRRLTRDHRCIPLRWVHDMPTLLHAADVVVHNAGGLSCQEALAAGVPVITYRCIPGHGQTNVAALDLSGLVAHAPDLTELHRLLHAALADELTAVQRSAAAALLAAPDPATVITTIAGEPST